MALKEHNNRFYNLIFWAVIMGQVIFLAVSVILRLKGIVQDIDLLLNYRYVIIIVALIAFAAGHMRFRKSMEALHDKKGEDLEAGFRVAFLFRLISAETAGIILITGYLFTGSRAMLLAQFLLLFLMLQFRPGEERIKRNWEDIK